MKPPLFDPLRATRFRPRAGRGVGVAALYSLSGSTGKIPAIGRLRRSGIAPTGSRIADCALAGPIRRLAARSGSCGPFCGPGVGLLISDAMSSPPAARPRLTQSRLRRPDSRKRASPRTLSPPLRSISVPIYLKQEDELVAMVAQPYEAEDLLQELLAKYPGLLAGDEDDTSRKWLLVQRELGVASEEDGAGRWSIDHLFIDDRGIPTLVEVKRSSNTEIRRQVVGQLLEYAANASADLAARKAARELRGQLRGRRKGPNGGDQRGCAWRTPTPTHSGSW